MLLPFTLLSLALATAPDSQRDAQWRQDLDVLSSALKAPGYRIAAGVATRGQKDFAILYPHFDAEIQSLKTDIPNLPDSEVLLRLMHLIASAHVAHNRVQIPLGMGFANRLPLTFSWLADGLAIVAAAPEYSDAIGARVLSIADRSPEQFLGDIEPYITYENQAELHLQASEFMPARGVLQHLQMIDAEGKVAVRIENRRGEEQTLQIAMAPGNLKETGFREALKVPAPLYNSQPGRYYWHRYLEDSQTLYIQYNVCENDPKLRFDDFAKQVLADADRHSVRRVVLDLRSNGGGNSHVIRPLKSGLAARLKSVGKVYVLIGPYTFSSAVDNAVELRRELSARLVGEPSGGMPEGYGEVATVTLPNSKLVVRFTTKRWGSIESEGPTSLIPDIPAPMKRDDLLAGRDPALEAAIGRSEK